MMNAYAYGKGLALAIAMDAKGRKYSAHVFRQSRDADPLEGGGKSIAAAFKSGKISRAEAVAKMKENGMPPERIEEWLK